MTRSAPSPRRPADRPHRASGYAAPHDRAPRPGRSSGVDLRCRRWLLRCGCIVRGLAPRRVPPVQLRALLDSLLQCDHPYARGLRRDLGATVRDTAPDVRDPPPTHRQDLLQVLRILAVEILDPLESIRILDVEVRRRTEAELARVQTDGQADERRVVILDLPVVRLTLDLQIRFDLVELRHQLLERRVRLQIGILRSK